MDGKSFVRLPNPAAEDGTDGVRMLFVKWRSWVHVPRGERCGGRDFLFQPNQITINPPSSLSGKRTVGIMNNFFLFRSVLLFWFA